MKTRKLLPSSLLIMALLTSATIVPPSSPHFFSAPTDFYRSTGTSGLWSALSTWESSSDNITWSPATAVPTSTAADITISTGTTVTIDVIATASNITVASGAVLNHANSISFTISDGVSGPDFIIFGTYVLNGTQPSITGSATAQVNSTGVVRVDDNTGGQADNFPRNTKVLFKTGSVFQWNYSLAFQSAGNVSYFVGSGYQTEYPIFRITKNIGPLSTTAPNILTINGKLEGTTGVSNNIAFKGDGIKIIRDGFGGNEKFTHQGTCGLIRVTGVNAVIDGTVVLNFNDNSSVTTEFEIASGAICTISGSPTITINTSSDFLINGTLINNGTNPIYLNDANLHINGYLSGNGTFSCTKENTNIYVDGTGNAGFLNLTIGADTVNNFTLNRTGQIDMGSDLVVNGVHSYVNGIITTGNHLLTNKKGNVIYPTVYTSSFVATCTSTGSPLTGLDVTSTIPFAGNVGYRMIGLDGSSFVMFPISADLNAPNRMEVNPLGSSTEMTVALLHGDITSTPSPRVNRVWFAYSPLPINVKMRLHFRKINWSAYNFGSVSNNEIEDGFNRFTVALVRKDYSAGNYFTHASDTTDIGLLDGSETYKEYSTGVGLPNFYKFAVVNPDGIILSFHFSPLRVVKTGPVNKLLWTSYEQENITSYTVQRSADTTRMWDEIGSVPRQNGDNVDYQFIDSVPIAKAYYRIVGWGKDGKKIFSEIQSVSREELEIRVINNPPINGVTRMLNTKRGQTIILTSSAGNRVKTIIVTGAITEISTQGLAPGIYFITIFDSKGIVPNENNKIFNPRR